MCAESAYLCYPSILERLFTPLSIMIVPFLFVNFVNARRREGGHFDFVIDV